MDDVKYVLTVVLKSGDIHSAYFYSMSQAMSFVSILMYYEVKSFSVSEWSNVDDKPLEGKEAENDTDR